ncbi:hypothetical protein FSP39_003433, partial [Pinctada imbricata]
ASLITGPIECYTCIGDANNSSCADPVNIRRFPLESRECIHGVCLKWTHYINGKLYIERTCSALLEMNIMLVHDVCRTESFGNGYLCMCGRHLCNGGNSNHKSLVNLLTFTSILIMCLYRWMR